MVSEDQFVFFYLYISYILYCVFDHVNTTAGGFQVIVRLVLSFLRLIKVVVDLSHVNVFGPVSSPKCTLKTPVCNVMIMKNLTFHNTSGQMSTTLKTLGTYFTS